MTIQPETLLVAGEEVVIDSRNLAFNEDTINDYIQREGGYYDYFGAHLARAERYLLLCERQMDDISSARFEAIKDEKGGSDALTTNRVKCDPDYRKARDAVIEAKYRVTRLKNHLRSWDKNHENAQSLGHTLRRAMDKINGEVRLSNGDTVSKPWFRRDEMYKQFDEVDVVIGHFGEEEKESQHETETSS